jgi:hypothetical protein
MIVITVGQSNEADEIYELIKLEVPAGSIHLSSSRGFDGTVGNDIVIFASIVAPVVINRIADVLVSFINSKVNRRVSVNGVDIKGYSADDAAKLLRDSDRERQPRRSTK